MVKNVWELEDCISKCLDKISFTEKEKAYFWNSLLDVGTNISICSVDPNEIKCIWSEQLFMVRLTVEDMIRECISGMFDRILVELRKELKGLPLEVMIPTIESFLIQYHAKYISSIFNCYVSIPLPAQYYDSEKKLIEWVENSGHFGNSKLIVELPFTKVCLKNAQQFMLKDIPIAIDTVYSLRQHMLIHFLGLGEISIFPMKKVTDFFLANNIGGALEIGQKIAINIQNGIAKQPTFMQGRTHFLISGINSYLQICELGGIDVIELSPLEALSAKEKLAPGFDSSLHKSNYISMSQMAGFRQYRLANLWELSKDEEEFFFNLSSLSDSKDFEEILNNGPQFLEKLFPFESSKLMRRLHAQGSYLKYAHWRRSIANNKASVDALLTTNSIYDKQRLQAKFRRVIGSKLKSLPYKKKL